MKKYKKGIVWLRRDLRIQDNAALSEATQLCEQVAVVFVFDNYILSRLKNKNDQRITFIFDTLDELNSDLESYGSQLIVRSGTPIEEIKSVVKELDAEALFFNEDYESYAKKRDKTVCKSLKGEGVSTLSFKDHVIFSGSEILKSDKTAYQVFTPYKRAWLRAISSNDYIKKEHSLNFIKKNQLNNLSEKVSIKSLGFERALLPLSFQKPGRKAALQCLSNFGEFIHKYKDNRDFPYLGNGTSGLSVHLRFGTLSIRECLRTCISIQKIGARTLLSELIWREFYQMIIDQYAYVEKSAFKQKYKNIKWSKNRSHFNAWCEGRTGFPIVDAGMRQLNETGWMHNRLRMITASFLVKDLLIDWRQGEKYFAEKLLDFDLASNNGGWQWCASTGCDAQPYFRVFNPSLQSQRFDPNADFIKQWVPELRTCSLKEIHFPEKSQMSLLSDYPRPIVKHAGQKDRAIQMFKEVSND